MSKHSFTLKELAQNLSAPVDIVGDSNCMIHRISTLQSAEKGSLSFFANASYLPQLKATRACAVLCQAKFIDACPSHALVVENPYLSYARLSHLFDTQSKHPPSIDSSAVIAEGVYIPDSVYIGPQVVIESGVVVKENVSIGAGCYIGHNCHIGKGSILHSGVTLYHQIWLGERVIIHSGAVIGADGFAFAPDQQGRRHKIAQLGGVRIGDDVEIGASTTIDRGSLDDTVLEQGVKLDNQVQIGHNVRIGAHSVLAGCVGVAGSTRIGQYCQLGGAVGVSGHLTITDHVIVSVRSLVSQSIKKPGVYSSGTPLDDMATWKKNMLRFKQLDTLNKRVRELEQKIEAINKLD